MGRRKKTDNPINPIAEASEAIEGLSEQTEQQSDLATSQKQKVSAPGEAGSEQKSKEAPAQPLEKSPAPEMEEQDEFGGDYNKLRKSYKESYAWNTRMAQELAELKGKVEGMTTSIGSRNQQPQHPAMTQERFNEWYGNDPLAASAWLSNSIVEERARKTDVELARLNQRLGKFISKSAEGSFKSRYSDVPMLEGELNAEVDRLFPEVRKNPEDYADIYEQAYETAYWTLKGKKAGKIAEAAKSQGRQEAEANLQKRQEAVVEGGGKAPAEMPIDLKNASSEDLLRYGKAVGIPSY